MAGAPGEPSRTLPTMLRASEVSRSFSLTAPSLFPSTMPTRPLCWPSTPPTVAPVGAAQPPSHTARIRMREVYAQALYPPLKSMRAGKVFVVWADCRFESRCRANDMVMSTSSNGTTWSMVTRIPADAVGSGVDHFIPGLAVDKSTSGSTAHLVLAFDYYPVSSCSSSTCQLDIGYSSSTMCGEQLDDHDQHYRTHDPFVAG